MLDAKGTAVHRTERLLLEKLSFLFEESDGKYTNERVPHFRQQEVKEEGHVYESGKGGRDSFTGAEF